MDRLARLKALVQENPHDQFARYGLAMELAGQGQLEESWDEFQSLMSVDSEYLPTYFQAGQLLERLNRVEEARQVYHRGIAVAKRRGDLRTCSELESALNLLD